MKRTAYYQLLEWKNKTNDERKPLILQGARQVGKTWLLEELGRKEFKNVAYINFEEQPALCDLFEKDFDVKRILAAISISSSQELIGGETLIILDEIQEAKRGLLALKYMYINAPEYHIAAAGSLLGIALHSNESFPVGKVEFINIEPLSFIEFLYAVDATGLAKALESGDISLILLFREKYIEFLRQYYYIGGMPEVVADYIQKQDLKRVRQIHNSILEAYRKDFSKHPPISIIPRIRLVWDSVPSQLAKENKKFIYGAIREGARAKEFELAIEWLSDAGAINKITRINNAELPAKAYEDVNAFKLYCVDIGLLGAMSGLSANALINGNEIFSQYKGALTEQYVYQQLRAMDINDIHYWSPNNGSAEVDFVIQYNDHIIPIEVKAEENLKAKSLKVYRDKYHPSIALRLSMSDYREQDELINIPLYAINIIENIFNEEIKN